MANGSNKYVRIDMIVREQGRTDPHLAKQTSQDMARLNGTVRAIYTSNTFKCIDQEGSVPYGKKIVVFSDNYVEFHLKYGLHEPIWNNRIAAPFPDIIINKMRSLIIDNPHYPTVKLMIQRFMRRRDGVRFEMKENDGARLSLPTQSTIPNKILTKP
eukprot:1010115_1